PGRVDIHDQRADAMSDSSVWNRGGSGSSGAGEPGFDAVRREFGDDMVQRIKNWPKIAEVYAAAQYAEPGSDVEKATRDMNRARTDRDFALAQARRVAGNM